MPLENIPLYYRYGLRRPNKVPIAEDAVEVCFVFQSKLYYKTSSGSLPVNAHFQKSNFDKKSLVLRFFYSVQDGGKVNASRKIAPVQRIYLEM